MKKSFLQDQSRYAVNRKSYSPRIMNLARRINRICMRKCQSSCVTSTWGKVMESVTCCQ